MKLFKQKDKLNMEEVNDVISLSKKILHLLYTVMIIAIILIVTIIAREWGIWNFILNILSVLAPFFLGFILAWILNPLVTRLERKKIPRTLGAFIVYAAFLLILLLFIRFLIPTIYQQLQILIANLPGILKELEVVADRFVFIHKGKIIGEVKNDHDDIEALYREMINNEETNQI